MISSNPGDFIRRTMTVNLRRIFFSSNRSNAIPRGPRLYPVVDYYHRQTLLSPEPSRWWARWTTRRRTPLAVAKHELVAYAYEGHQPEQATVDLNRPQGRREQQQQPGLCTQSSRRRRRPAGCQPGHSWADPQDDQDGAANAQRDPPRKNIQEKAAAPIGPRCITLAEPAAPAHPDAAPAIAPTDPQHRAAAGAHRYAGAASMPVATPAAPSAGVSTPVRMVSMVLN
jgi:hypothetical protein